MNGTDLYQLSLKSIQDDINNAEIAYNKAKTTTDNAAATLETRKAAVPGLKTEYEKAVKNAESIKMNFNTQRAMVNRSKTEYDETAKAAAAAYEIYEQYKQKADALLEEYNRVTSTTSSINIEYENARKSVDKILNDIDNAKDNIKNLKHLMMIQLLFLIMQSLNMRTPKHNMMKSLLHNRILQQICLRLRMNLTNVLLMKKLRKSNGRCSCR